MDLTSLNNASAARPDGYDNPHVETRVAFDEYGQPIYVAVPAPSMSDHALVHVPTQQSDRLPMVYRPSYLPVPYSPPAAPATYSPLHDPIVCRLLAGTVAVVGGAFALSFVLAALAAATTALGLLLGILALIWLLASGKGGSGKSASVTVNITNKSKHQN